MAMDNPTQEPQVLEKKTDDEVTSSISLVTPSSYVEPIVTRKELWSYYLYFNGNTGVGLYGTLTLFQGFATAAGYDPVRGPGSSCLDSHASGECVVPWGGGTRAVSSVVLLANGLSFAMMMVILTLFGPAADYGSFSRWPLLVSSLIYWGSMFSTLSLASPSRWGAAMGISIVCFTALGVTTAFYTANFPRLARNTPRSRELKERYERGEISTDVYMQEIALEKSKISTISWATCGIGAFIMPSLNLILLTKLQDNARVDNYVIVLSAAYAVLVGIWWFIFQKPRPGPRLPEGESYFTIGWKQIWIALKQGKKLPNTFIYLVAYFLLADSINTTLTLVKICQNLRFNFSFKENSYFNIVQGGVSTIGLITYWHIQRYWKIDAKKMFVVTNVMAALLPLWGMIGIWTDRMGYRNIWEFWAYNVAFGIFQAPYWSFSQTIMAELSPPGFDFMFFSLFGFVNQASSIVGPNVIQAIINKTGNTWDGFAFLFAISLVSSLVIWFGVDIPKGRQDAERWAMEQRDTAYAMYSDRNREVCEEKGKES